MLEQAISAARAGRDRAEQDLYELLGIPSVSALSEHQGDVRRAGRWVADRLDAMGMRVEFREGEGHPVVSAEWLRLEGAPTLALYGHYDVQPPDPLEEWQTPPFEPSVRDGRVYARGASDNKGQMMAALKAAEYAFAAGAPPLNLRFLIEGEEEVSGPSLPAFVRINAERLKSDYLFIADGLFTAPGLPNLVTGLRGLAGGEIEVTGASADLHSGIYGGVAPNPFHSLVHILAALKGRDGRISIPGFYETVRPPSENELAAWNRVPVDEESLKRDLGVPALEGEQEYSVHERRWARPTFEIHGIIGGFTGEGVKTVIPARARAKITMRLVPEQDPQRVVDALAEYLPELATPGVKVSFRANESAPAVLAGVEHAGVDAAKRAFQAAFDAEPVLVREGGSIPVATAFQEALHPHMLISGFGLPDDGLHSPNEHFSLDQYHRGTEMVLHLMHQLADAGG